jgi:hypothetical protein
MKYTKAPWIYVDRTFTGNSVIQNAGGIFIGEIYNDKDVKLVVAAPKMHKLLDDVKGLNYRTNDNEADDISIPLSLLVRIEELLKELNYTI